MQMAVEFFKNSACNFDQNSTASKTFFVSFFKIRINVHMATVVVNLVLVVT